MSRESGISPKRTDTSMLSSGRLIGRSVRCNWTSTSGYASLNAEMAGPIYERPKPSGAFTRNRPFGAARLLETSCSMSSMSLRMRWAFAKYTSPSLVRLMRRVVRLSSRTPSRSSSDESRRDTAGGVRFSSRAVAARLPCLTSRQKKPSSESILIREFYARMN
jgi:hypothetical protein